MDILKKKLVTAILPMLVLVWGLALLVVFDPFYSKSSDPEYPYLVNGLNCASLKFNYIGHIDHPGTPFQMYNGAIIRVVHLVSGKGTMANDVFARPEHYLNAISASLLLLQAALILIVGFLGLRRGLSLVQIALLQGGFLFNDVLLWLFSRVNPDRFFMIAGLLFIVVFLKYGYENRSPFKFALWSGVTMALGLATKFNFLPVLALPLLLIDNNKNRLVYVASGIVAFFAFIAPIITKFDDYLRFLTGIFQHDGLYGNGEVRTLNFSKIADSVVEIARVNPELVVLIVALIVSCVVAFRSKSNEVKKYGFLFVGYLGIIALQVIMVSKHFKNYYLAPVFIIYGFVFFTISLFLVQIIKDKKYYSLIFSVLPVVFFVATLIKSGSDLPIIEKQMAQREKIRTFVGNGLPGYWFIEPTWESGPQVENAIVYGLSYCGHRDKYLPELLAVNPKVITYEGPGQGVKLWRGAEVSLDSVVATGENIHIYSSQGRNAGILLQMVDEAANRNELKIKTDTIYADEAEHKIIRIKALGARTGWNTSKVIPDNRQVKIDRYVREIKESAEWLEKVRQKAVQKNIPLDSMILLDAIWMVDTEK